MIVDVPASSANLGSGFDALGLALDVRATLGIVELSSPIDGAHVVEPTHPAAVAFDRAGGVGRLWVRSPIPMARGMGYSGSMRVGGAALALARNHHADDGVRAAVLAVAAELEGHPDNVAASVYGGVTVAAAGHVLRVPTHLDPDVVLWVPRASSARTDASRAALPDPVPRAVAVDTIGRAALLVAALVQGDHRALADAMSDSFHQPHRLVSLPGSAAALEAMLAEGAWCAWLSGSGPTVAAWCQRGTGRALADRVRRRVGRTDDATVRVHHVEPAGFVVRPPASG